jgi:plasmid stability protein
MRVASLTIRNIPEPVLEGLRARAAVSKRSMQREVLAILEAAAAEGTVRMRAPDVLERVRLLGLPQESEAMRMIRADRDGR